MPVAGIDDDREGLTEAGDDVQESRPEKSGEGNIKGHLKSERAEKPKSRRPEGQKSRSPEVCGK
jgi:hypothetical protein